MGAEAVHRVLNRWLLEFSGPQVPVRTEGFTGAARVDEPFPGERGDGGQGPADIPGAGAAPVHGQGPVVRAAPVLREIPLPETPS